MPAIPACEPMSEMGRNRTLRLMAGMGRLLTRQVWAESSHCVVGFHAALDARDGGGSAKVPRRRNPSIDVRANSATSEPHRRLERRHTKDLRTSESGTMRRYVNHRQTLPTSKSSALLAPRYARSPVFPLAHQIGALSGRARQWHRQVGTVDFACMCHLFRGPLRLRFAPLDPRRTKWARRRPTRQLECM